jgi:drug/metabolite transporter (DMT)-like permease
MLWVLPAALGAVANAGYYIAMKRQVAITDRNVLAAGTYCIAGLLLCATALVQGIPPTGDALFAAVAGTTVLNILAMALLLKALSGMDISLAVPLISVTPVFLIVTSFLLLQETPTLTGITGICVAVAGSYILFTSGSHTGFADPFRAILNDRNSLSMLAVAFLYAVALNFNKIVVENSDPIFGSALICLALGIAFSLILVITALIRKGKRADRPGTVSSGIQPAVDWETVRRSAPALCGIALLLAIESVMINYAFTLQIVPYVIAIKRFSIILTVGYGTLVEHERDPERRLTGSVLMVAGAVLILVAG